MGYINLNSRASKYQIMIVSNKGRDVLPFLKQMANNFKSYNYKNNGNINNEFNYIDNEINKKLSENNSSNNLSYDDTISNENKISENNQISSYFCTKNESNNFFIFN